jgi:hypothetical protein
MITELHQRVFATRDAAQRAHWKTKSEPAHRATGEFYEASIKALDTVVETYIAMFGLFDMTAIQSNYSPADILAHLEDEMDWIETNRDEIANGSSCVGNLIDNLTAVYAHAVFLLRMK